MDVSTPSVSKLIDLLPLIIISVIVLIGFFTWEIFTKHLDVFILLLTSILFAIWLYSGDIISYLGWKNASEKDPGDPIISSPPNVFPFETNDKVLWIIVTVVGIVLALGLLLGLMSYDIGAAVGETSKKSDTVKYIGYGFMGVGGIIILSILWKAFWPSASDASSEEGSENSGGIFGPNIFKIIAGVVFSIIGIRFIVQSNEVKTKEAENIDDKTFATNSVAGTFLNIGLILQVIALLGAIYLMYRYKWFHPEANTDPINVFFSKFSLFVLTIISGILFIARQQKWPGFTVVDSTESKDHLNKTYAAHGIIYMIIAGLSLAFAGSKINTFTMFRIVGLVTFLALIGVVIWNFVTLNSTPDFTLGDPNKEESDPTKEENYNKEYYQQLRDEVKKELSKSGNLEDATEPNIKQKMKERIDSLNKSSNQVIKPINNVLLAFAIVISILILLFYHAKMKIIECKQIPASIVKIFTGKCDNTADFKENANLKKFLDGDQTKFEKMNADNWSEILDKYDGDASDESNFSVLSVHFAKLSRWIPFLTIILIVTCVSILFTKVTTSEDTMSWIAKSFRGDMYPKVKELLDTFFIVFIVGLLLCAILLLPFVRELNVGGLNVITKFIDSIQVWQYQNNNEISWKNYLAVIIGPIAVWFIGLSWWVNHVAKKGWGDAIPENSNWGWAIAAVSIFAFCCIPAFYHVVTGKPHDDFKNDMMLLRGLRLFGTSVYLVPWLLISIFKLILFLIIWGIEILFEKAKTKITKTPSTDQPGESFKNEFSKWQFWKWEAAKAGTNDTDSGTDLRLFGLGKILLPKDVITGEGKDAASAAKVPPASASASAPGSAAPAAPAAASASTETAGETVDQTRVNAVGKLIKVIFIVILVVIMILIIIYTVYRIGAQEKNPGTVTDTSNPEDPGIIEKMNSPTAHTIYIIMAIVGIAGLVAYLREKFKETNSKTPEDYVFNDLKPEDSNNPMRQLTFGMTHIIYIVLMIVVWIYDTEKDDKDRMSVTGMTVLGILILFFHYVLEFADNKLPRDPTAPPDEKPKLAPMTNLLSNVRFIANTVFLIVLSVLAYYKQHGVMVAVIVIMFIFHLTKSILGIKILKFVWACIIYIPCLFLDLIQGLQGSVGDTSRTIWIIVAIELLLIAILYGGPYLLNYIGASASQMVAAPISLKQKYDTKLTTQSKEIFIYHNTGVDRAPEDIAANCPPEEKMRYSYGISGWFLLNNSVLSSSNDLEIFNFGDVPKMTYNVSKNELKIYCKTLDTSSKVGVSDAPQLIYNSRTNYNQMVIAQGSSEEKKTKVQMALEDEELDVDIPLQRWNYFVINYDGKNMDFFLNNKFVAKSNFIMPDIQLKPITVGDTDKNNGLNGSICNFAFHKVPLTKEQMRWTYNMLKSQNPPMIGMATVEDEIKATGSTTVYSR